MNLLDSILCTSKAQEYTTSFKQHGIDAFTLKLLNDDDLKILGIKESEKRELILQNVANLQVPAEKHTEIDINEKYIELTLAQMSVQLTRHLAALSIAVNRPDTVICNVRLGPATCCLENCVKSLEKRLNEFENRMITKQKKKPKNKHIIIPVLVIVSLGVVSYKICISFLNR